MDGSDQSACKNDRPQTVRLAELQKGTEAEFMQNRVSLGGQLTTSLWTMIFAGGLVAVACSWITLTSISAQAADPNNILLDFSATWCGPCQQMSPIVSRLERQGYPIRKVDVDQEKELTQKYNVESIPCFVLIANGREINRITGATDEKQLKRLMMMLPKQNIDDPFASKNSEKKRSNPSESVASKSNDDKKGFLAIPPLFPKKKKEAQAADDESEVFRGQDPGPAKAGDFSREAMAASTRIRVKDGSHVHYGSGTIIESQPGRAIILTCGHILRKLGKQATIEVDLFPEGTSNPQTANAQILKYDLEADVGLLAIASPDRLPVVKLALSRELPKVKDRAFSIGCGGGKLPSIEEHAITAVNGFEGPDNLECTGVPLQGRSGGGLFMGMEQVGVCILADSNYKRGIYTGMKPVAQLLQKAGLDYLLPSAGSSDLRGEGLAAASVPPVSELSQPAPAKEQMMAQTLPASVGVPENTAAPSLAAQDYEGAEIVCTIHPKTPGGVTRVVIINQASSRILNDLLHESSSASRPESSATVQNAVIKKMNPNRTSSNANIPVARATNPKRTESDNRPIETSYEAQRN